MPSNGELVFGLKNQGIKTNDKEYAQHIANWLKINIFHNQPLSDTDTEWINWFSDNPGSFKKRVRELAKANRLKYGFTTAVDEWLRTNIDFCYVCNCSKCTTTTTTTITDEDVEMEDVGPDLDADKEENENESLKLRDSDFSEDAIIHRAMQILYKRYGTNARLAVKKIVEGEGELEILKEFMDEVTKDHDKLSHEMFLHIADQEVLADTKVLQIAQTIRSYEGRDSIEANLKAKLKEHGEECDKFFDVFEEEFDIHYKDEENKKIIHKVSELRKHMVIILRIF